MAKDCNKAATAKARTALVTKDKPSSITIESKKIGSNPLAPALDQGVTLHVTLHQNSDSHFSMT